MGTGTNFNDAIIAVNNSASKSQFTGLAVTNRPSAIFFTLPT